MKPGTSGPWSGILPAVPRTGPVRTIAVVLGLVICSAFVLFPLIGRLPVVRAAPILLFGLIVIAVVSRPWSWTEAEWSAVGNWNPSRRVIRLGGIVVGLTLFWFVLTRFQSGEINAIDFTVYYDRPTFQTWQGRPSFVESADDPIRAYRSYFAVHAHWVMLPLSAFYLVWATPFWLLALSVVAVVAGAICTLRIVQQTGAGGLLGCASALAFVLNDNTARTLNYGFHTEVLYAWFIPWTIHAGLQSRRASFAVAALGCVLVKEDAFLALFAVAVTLALTKRGWTPAERLLFLVAPMLVATLNLALYYRYLVPSLSATGTPFYANYWDNYGPTAMTAAIGMLGRPGDVILRTLTSSFFTKVIVPHLYLPLIGWRWVVGVAPIVILYGASSNEQLRSFGIYYAIVLVPFLVPGAAAGAQRVTMLLWSDRHRARVAASFLVVCGALLAGITNAGYSLRPWKPEVAAVPGILETLAQERAVLVQSGLYPHAGYESRVQLLTKDTLRDPQYAGAAILLAPRVSGYPLTPDELAALSRLPVITSTPDGVLVVRRSGGR
jgi:uncharacterized membrane protein